MGKISKKEDIWLEKNVSSFLLFFICLLVAPTFILIKNILLKLLQLFIFFSLSIINKKRLHIKGATFFLLITVIMNIIIPHEGKVLIKVVSFPIFEEALLEGLYKAFALLGLLYLSKAMLTGGLPFKGKWGRLLSKTLAHFFLLMEDDYKEKSYNIYDRLDKVLRKAYANRKRLLAPLQVKKSTLLGLFSVCILLAVNWFFVVFQFRSLV